KAVLASLAALAAAALAWLALSPEKHGVERTEVPLAAGETHVALAEAPREEVTPPTRDVERESVASTADIAETAALPEATPANPLFAILSGLVAGEASRPIPGAEVLVRRPEAGHFTMLDLETRHAPKECARARTDAAGRFSFELERGIPFDLAVSAN